MREILFRGKQIDNGEWVEGYISEYMRMPRDTNPYIVWVIECKPKEIYEYEMYEVIPETVGQYTGLTDKNGKRIFEGDIVKTHYVNTKKNDFVEQIVFHNGRFCSMYKISEHGRMWANLPDGIPRLNKTPYMEWCEVIGNIHDNPELVKGECT